jgi:O-antigen/teichoic acid export membrane protein
MGNTAPLLITGIFGLAIAILMTRRQPVQGDSTLNHRQGAALLLRYGYPLFFSTILAGGLAQIYRFLMALHANSHSIGNYQAAVNFSVLITFFTMPIATVLFPLFSKLNPNDERLATIFKNSVTYAALITAPVTMAIILLAEPLVETIYSGTYTLTPFYMKLYLLTFLFIGLGNLSVVSLLNGQGNTKVTLRIHLINLAIGVLLSLWLIPNHGIVGLIATTIITSQMGQTYGLLWIKRNLGFTIDLRKTVKIYTASTISFVILYAIFTVVKLGSIPTLLVGAASYATLYILLILSFKTIGQEDINNLRQVFSAMGPLTPLFTYVLNRLERHVPRKN